MQLEPQDLRRAEWLARLLVPPVVASIGLGGIYLSALFDEPPGWSIALLMIVVLQVYIISEGVRGISRVLQRWLPWRERFGQRVLLQLLASLSFACIYLVLVYLPFKLREIAEGSNDVLGWPHFAITLLVALVFGIALSLLQLLFDVLREWQQSEVEAERLRRHAVRAELDALKAQVNPHFLFNSLNTLYGLIESAPDRACALVLELSDVFRYVLKHGEHDLVPLTQELDFLQAYLRILGARHGAGLQVELGALGDTQAVAVPPMSLQLLVENAVRHNRLELDEPLSVEITRAGDSLRVRNPLRPKRGSCSGAGVGLSNLAARYRVLGKQPLELVQDSASFNVLLPLLPCPR